MSSIVFFFLFHDKISTTINNQWILYFVAKSWAFNAEFTEIERGNNFVSFRPINKFFSLLFYYTVQGVPKLLCLLCVATVEEL